MPNEAAALFRRLSRTYRTPREVQRLLRKIPYNREPDGDSVRSALSTWRTKKAHCLEAAFLAAAILEHRGYPPLVLSLESQDNLDHVIYVFRDSNRWGSLGRSRDEGLHGRPPVFRSLRDLARSYVAPFVDKTGRITAFGLANLDDSGSRWRDSPKNVWCAEKFLIELRHQKLPTSDVKYRRLLADYLHRGPVPLNRSWW